MSLPKPEQIALNMGDVGIAICLLATPILLGGRHDAGRFVYIIGASLAAIGVYGNSLLCGKQPRIHGGILAIISGSIALLVLQITEMPQELIRALGPGQEKYLPLWGENTIFGAWQTFSMTPTATIQGLALLIAHGLLTIAIFARIRKVEDIHRLIRWIGLAAVGMAIIAFAQFAAPNGKLLWIYDHPQHDFGSEVHGTFANKNHFAHFLVLGLGPICWIASTKRHGISFRRENARMRLFGLTALTVLVVAIFASQSRGGVIALAVASSIALALYWRAGAIRLPQLLAILFVLTGGVAGVSLYGYDKITNRMDDLLQGRVEQLDATHSRRSIWAANAKAFVASPIVGFGVGSHREVYPLFLEEDFTREFTHAESGYLQIATETGAVGLALLLTTLAFIIATIAKGLFRPRDFQTTSLWVAIVSGIAASVAHSTIDFVWYIPGLLAVTITLCVSAIRLEQLTRDSSKDRKREASSIVLRYASMALVTTFSIVATSIFIGPARTSFDWDSYLRSSISLRAMSQKISSDSTGNSDKMLGETIVRTTGYTTDLLNRVIKKNPNHARAHLRLAGRFLQRYELESSESINPMPVTAVRDAANNGGFKNQEEMHRWLDRALVGRANLLRKAYIHAEAAVNLCPLQGEAYLYLSSLSFLAPEKPSELSLIDQAIRVRPYNGEVLFEAGRQYWLKGEYEKGLVLWKSCVRRSGSHLFKLAFMLSNTTPSRIFVEELNPGYEAIEIALKQYQRFGTREDMIVLCQHAKAEATKAEEAGEEPPAMIAKRWRHASETLRSVDQFDEALACAKHALELAPYDFWIRLEIANALRSVELFSEADPHIRWCLARRPDIRYLSQWLEESAKRRTEVDHNRRSRKSLYEKLASKDSQPSHLSEDSIQSHTPEMDGSTTSRQPNQQPAKSGKP
jgi:O-antigen ligase/tetratricopeptide (TPR) repeat protein